MAAEGIYEINHGRLKLCLARYSPAIASEQHPKSFSVNPDSGTVLLVLEHYVPSADEKAIEDFWTVRSESEGGQPMPREQIGDSFAAKQYYFGDNMVTTVQTHGQSAWKLCLGFHEAAQADHDSFEFVRPSNREPCRC